MKHTAQFYAKKAKRLILSDTCNCRGFENCFEMGNGGEVVGILLDMVTHEDPPHTFRAAIRRNKRYMPSALNRAGWGGLL